MSQCEDERTAKKTQPDRKAAQTERELSDAELAAISAAGEPTKGPGPEGPQKKPEPKGM